MKIIKDEEHTDLYGNPSPFYLNDDFQLVILSDFRTDDFTQEVMETIPKIVDFAKFYVV